MIVSGSAFPMKGLGWRLCSAIEAIDGGLKIEEGVEDALLQSPACEFCEEVLDRIEP